MLPKPLGCMLKLTSKIMMNREIEAHKPIKSPFFPNFLAPINEPMKFEIAIITMETGEIIPKGRSIFVKASEKIKVRIAIEKTDMKVADNIGLI